MDASVIIVGGAGDRLFGCARRYADDLAQRCPDLRVIYLTQGRRRALARHLSTGQTSHLIGHSWGAADVSWALRQGLLKTDQGMAVAVDPVGKPGLWRPCSIQANIERVRVDGTGSEGRLMDGNLTAQIGRLIGHRSPEGFAGSDLVRIEAPYAHYDMTRMMRHPGPDGLSAEDRLLHRLG